MMMSEPEEIQEDGMTTPQEETVVEDTQEASDDVAVDTEAAEPEEAPPPEPEPEVVEDLPVRDWMKSIIMPDVDTMPEKQVAEAQPGVNPFADSIFDEDTQNLLNTVIQQQVDQRLQGVEAKANEADRAIKEQRYNHAKNAVGNTLQSIHKNLYNDQFRNDPDLQGNEKLAEFVDNSVQNFMRDAAIEAIQFNDFKSLNMANHPKFGRLMTLMAKEMNGIPDGKTKPIAVKGAVVEASTPQSSGEQGALNLTANDRKAMKDYGITEAEMRKSIKVRGSDDFSDYDSD
jgi:hypothetical protein